MLDWDDLRYFVTLADQGSLAAAGRHLGVDHVTVARRVAALEERIGIKLVDRRQKRTLLTPDGLRIADHARRMQDEAFSLERALQASRGALAGDVSVSLPPLLASHWIAPQLGAFTRAFPDISLRLSGENRTASLARGEADIAVRLSRPASGALVARKIGSIRYQMAASRSYLEATPDISRAYILFDHTLPDAAQERWMLGLIGGRPKIALRSNELPIQAAAAAAGAGIAVLPDFLAASLGLVNADPEGRSFERDLWLACHQDLRQQPAIAAVLAFLASCVPGRDHSGS